MSILAWDLVFFSFSCKDLLKSSLVPLVILGVYCYIILRLDSHALPLAVPKYSLFTAAFSERHFGARTIDLTFVSPNSKPPTWELLFQGSPFFSAIKHHMCFSK